MPHIVVLSDGETWELISEENGPYIVEVSEDELESLETADIYPEEISDVDDRKASLFDLV